MSDTDSFINEVSEEVRRDALFVYLRRYGWIAVLAVVLIVGGAAWNEYSKAQARTLAQQTGDQMLDALSADGPEERAAALAETTIDGPAVAVSLLLTAATQQEAGQIQDAAATLGTLATNMDVPEIYRELAAMKAAMLPTDDADARSASLAALAQPGAPFRLIALEQLGLIEVENGDTEAAISIMRQISEDAAATRGLRERAQTLIVALGGDVNAPTASE